MLSGLSAQRCKRYAITTEKGSTWNMIGASGRNGLKLCPQGSTMPMPTTTFTLSSFVMRLFAPTAAFRLNSASCKTFRRANTRDGAPLLRHAAMRKGSQPSQKPAQEGLAGDGEEECATPPGA